MKNIILITLLQVGVFFHALKGQELPKTTQQNFNFSSKNHIRILDGFILPESEDTPNDLKINRVITVNNEERRVQYNLPLRDKPYMILSTEVSEIRNFIYDLAHVNSNLAGLNLPILLNGRLIVFKEYAILENVKKENILSAEFISTKENKSKNLTPFGIIKVITKK